MKRAVALALVMLLAGCHHQPAQRAPLPHEPLPVDTEPVPSEDTAPSSSIEVPTDSLADSPPCILVDSGAKVSPKPRRTVARPPVAESPPPAPAPARPAEATVKPVADLSMSVLGKKVHGPHEEDLGRVVDVIADLSGRVRVAIIEFGGFLGVGLKRVAVDWALLKFDPRSTDSPWRLDVSPEKLQAAPEYKDGHPYALMGPSAADAVPATGAAPAVDPKK